MRPVDVLMIPIGLNQESSGWSGNKSRPSALTELGDNHQVPISGCEGSILLSLSAPPSRGTVNSGADEFAGAVHEADIHAPVWGRIHIPRQIRAPRVF